MNLPCKVIEDLLPLYHDGICSEESKELVDRHLATCADCKEYLHNLKEKMILAQQPDTMKPLAAFQKALRQFRGQAMLKGILLTALICAVLVGAFWGLTQWNFLPVPTDEMRLIEVNRLENGHIQYELHTKGRDSFGFFDWTLTEDGSLYLTPKRAVILLHPEWSGLNAEFDPDNISGYRNIPNGTVIDAFYVGTPEDAILIWQRGMELPESGEEAGGGFRFSFGTEFETS